MNDLITIVRFPFGIIATGLVFVFWVLLSPFEIIAVIFGFIIYSRETIKENWVGTFPNTIRQIGYNISDIWVWVWRK